MIDIREIRKNSQCPNTLSGVTRMMLKKLTNYPAFNLDSPAGPHYTTTQMIC
jgi:hypothetical protein